MTGGRNFVAMVALKGWEIDSLLGEKADIERLDLVNLAVRCETSEKSAEHIV